MDFDGYHNLMNHRSKVHPSNKKCRNFLNGRCPHSDECWYVHDQTAKPEDSFENFKCELCERVFKGRYNFMRHRKLYHQIFLPQCESFNVGKCPRGEKECWFEHKLSESSRMNDKVWPRLSKSSPTNTAAPVFPDASRETFPPDQLNIMMKMIGNLSTKMQKMEEAVKDLLN